MGEIGFSRYASREEAVADIARHVRVPLSELVTRAMATGHDPAALGTLIDEYAAALAGAYCDGLLNAVRTGQAIEQSGRAGVLQ